MRHDLKCAPRWYDYASDQSKMFELRLDDRSYVVGDELVLHEYDEGQPTGRTLRRRVSCVVRHTDGPWLTTGYVALGLTAMEEE